MYEEKSQKEKIVYQNYTYRKHCMLKENKNNLFPHRYYPTIKTLTKIFVLIFMNESFHIKVSKSLTVKRIVKV